jgi:hypothetical protein
MKLFRVKIRDDEDGDSEHDVEAESEAKALDQLQESVPWQEVLWVKELKYSHVFTIAFYVESKDSTGEDVTAEMLRKALRKRLKCSDREMEEACGAPDATEPWEG